MTKQQLVQAARMAHTMTMPEKQLLTETLGGYEYAHRGMHLTPDDPISCGRAAAPVARVGDHLASVVGPCPTAPCAPVAGRWRWKSKPEGETLYKLLPGARVALRSPDTRSWEFGSQVHTPNMPIRTLNKKTLQYSQMQRGVSKNSILLRPGNEGSFKTSSKC